MDGGELKESDLRKLSDDTVYQIMEDYGYNRKTRVFAAIEFLSREEKRITADQLRDKT
ncbi:hypothetical protein NVP1039O_55 [Vibrio phage 1.039.O._10N.286.55.A2]|nr:hypothetical protein NVP1003O_56 [Vibrio phage 1.003.O._10N.286.48.A2]AUR83754.1 hypothetical protein NVP1039O_55 [Vibrio phage 1.039.O._10N.286.55.A2]AUR83873.1 hypothetical protein NVP1042O_85 [Vibrio phage 1.042.O._10N.286.45.B8]AUR84633.1 hypothetical protein NVP1061O_52 [Vibrio phage 1.061.O._10N.286.55.C2]